MELSSSIRWWEFTVDERELAANTWLHFNYFQMLTYVNMPILLLWEGVGEKVGVEFIHFLAFLQQVQVKPLGGAKQLFLGTLQWESNEELAPFPFFILFFVSWGARYIRLPTAHWQLPFDNVREHSSHLLFVAFCFRSLFAARSGGSRHGKECYMLSVGL